MWSVGIYFGVTPFRFYPAPQVRNPVLTRRDVTDVAAEFIADPFIVKTDGLWHMFFEVMNEETRHGVIGRATSADLISWSYQRVVLEEPFHLSYPYVFEWRNDYYMIPESYQAGSVRLYKADPFPDRWRLDTVLLEIEAVDASVFCFEDRWWMFACTTPHEHKRLDLYFADDLRGPWSLHALSPIVAGDRRMARPAGRVFVNDGRVIRYAQDCRATYGGQVLAFEVLELTPTTYRETESVLGPIFQERDSDWNRNRMHHIDSHRLSDGRLIACVDGR